MGMLRRDRENEVFTARQKWDYINLNDFRTRSCWSPIAYFFFFVNVFFGIAVVAADCYTAVNLLIFNRWSSKIDPFVPFSISKWIFAGCIIFSFVLIGFELLWSIRAIKGGSISRGYLNVYAQRWYCTGKDGYKRFLVFTALTKSKHGSDYVMLFSYFSFKGWAQILLADGPRQVLNGMTLYAVMQAKIVPGTQKDGLSGLLSSIKALEEESLTQAIILSVMLFTCVWWIFNFLQLALAVLLWIMFIWHHVPSGHTLSSYCREKIDKRLVGIVAKNHKRTLEEEAEERMKANKLGTAGRKPTIPILNSPIDGPAKIPGAPTLPVINEKPPGLGINRTNTMDTFTTTVSSKPDTNMPSRPPYAARPGFPTRASTEASATSSMFDDSASLLAGNRKDPFSRTNTPLNRIQPPVGPYSRNNDSQHSLTDPYGAAPMQPHDFLGSSQALPSVNRNDTISPFYANQRPPPVNRNDSITPMPNMAPTLPNLNFDPMRTNSPQPFPPGGPRRFPVRPQDANFAPNLTQSPGTYNSPPGSDFSTYTEHRHSPPIHHKPESEVFEMDGGIMASSKASPPVNGAIEMDATPVGGVELNSSLPKAPAKDNSDGFASHPMAFELDTGVDIPVSSTPQPQTRRLTPPTLTSTPQPQSRSPPRAGANAYVKPTYQPVLTSTPSSTPAPPSKISTPPPQLPQLPQISHNDFNFGREEHGVGRNMYGNYDIEADVLDSYIDPPRQQQQQQPPQQRQQSPPRPFATAQSQNQGSRPSTPTRIPIRRDYDDGYNNTQSLGSGSFGPPQRSMTATPSGYGNGPMRGLGGQGGEFAPPNRSMTSSPYDQVRMSPPRGSNGMNRAPPRGPPPPRQNMGGGYGYQGQGGNGGYGNAW
ncbi:hypothetical protein ABW19_dt0203663 [Dactylella cylindrospora]|nr:hypothetical protein ABW19_dt0203663 [Dactylella cylindrospora]